MRRIGTLIAEFGPMGKYSVAGAILIAPTLIGVIVLFLPPIFKFYGWWFRLWGM